MEQYILLCLDCHEIYPGIENHTCKRNDKNYLPARVDRVNGQVTKLDGSTISISLTNQEGKHSQSAVSTTSQETPSDQMRMTVKPNCQTFIEEDEALRFFPGGSSRDGSPVFKPEQPKPKLNMWPILQDGGFDHCSPREVRASHFQSFSDVHSMDGNIYLMSPGNMGDSAGTSNGWNVVSQGEIVDVEAHRRPEDGRFECPVCGKLANKKDHLLSHYRTHTGEKPYSCDMCEKKFRQKHVLIEHRRIHTGEKPFSCDVCNHKCRTKGSLKKHRKTHSGVTSCPICGKNFTNSGSCKKHIKSVHRYK